MINHSNTVAGIKLKNPILGASGTFGYGMLYEPFYPLESIGGFFTKGLSLQPRVGNPPPRIVETVGGMLNAIGLQNIGLEKFLNQKLVKLQKIDTAVIANFFGSSLEEYVECASRLDDADGVHGLEMNISCPNIREGGIQFGSDPDLTAEVVKACRKVVKKPLIIKLSPNVTDITLFAKICEDEGADGLSLINTLIGMAIDLENRRPTLSNITGGLSGPAIKPVALRMVWQCYKVVKIPIFGVGGICSAQDAAQFFMAGASAVQVGTHNFVEPDICAHIAKDLDQVLSDLGVDHYRELVGAAH